MFQLMRQKEALKAAKPSEGLCVINFKREVCCLQCDGEIIIRLYIEVDKGLGHL